MNNTEDPFLEDMNWINRTCKKSKKSMSETEINEDNCVLSNNDLRVIVQAFESYVDLICESSCGRSEEVAAQEGERLYAKIYKLNDLAKEKQK